jgi:hypothetical protein
MRKESSVVNDGASLPRSITANIWVKIIAPFIRGALPPHYVAASALLVTFFLSPLLDEGYRNVFLFDLCFDQHDKFEQEKTNNASRTITFQCPIDTIESSTRRICLLTSSNHERSSISSLFCFEIKVCSFRGPFKSTKDRARKITTEKETC